MKEVFQFEAPSIENDETDCCRAAGRTGRIYEEFEILLGPFNEKYN